MKYSISGDQTPEEIDKSNKSSLVNDAKKKKKKKKKNPDSHVKSFQPTKLFLQIMNMLLVLKT